MSATRAEKAATGLFSSRRFDQIQHRHSLHESATLSEIRGSSRDLCHESLEKECSERVPSKNAQSTGSTATRRNTPLHNPVSSIAEGPVNSASLGSCLIRIRTNIPLPEIRLRPFQNTVDRSGLDFRLPYAVVGSRLLSEKPSRIESGGLDERVESKVPAIFSGPL